MSEITPGVFFANFFGTTASAANAGTTPDDLLGTVVGIAQTGLGGASLLAGNIDQLIKPFGGAGIFLSAAGLYDNYLNIKTSLAQGKDPNLSDIAGAAGNAASLVIGGLESVVVSTLAY